MGKNKNKISNKTEGDQITEEKKEEILNEDAKKKEFINAEKVMEKKEETVTTDGIIKEEKKTETVVSEDKKASVMGVDKDGTAYEESKIIKGGASTVNIEQVRMSQSDLLSHSGNVVSFTTIDLELVKKDKMICNWEMELVNLFRDPIYRFKLKIGDFSDPLSFVIALYDLIWRVQTMYEGLFYDVPTVEMTEFNYYMERAADSAIGFNVFDAYKKLKDLDKSRNRGVLTSAVAMDLDRSVPLNDLYKDITFFTSQLEFDLQDKYHKLEQMKILPNGYDLMLEFYQSVVNDEKKVILTAAAGDPTVRLAYTYFTHLGNCRTSCFNSFIQNKANYFMETMISDMCRYLIMKSVTMYFKDEGASFKDMLSELRVSVNTYSEEQSVAVSVSQSNASSLFMDLLLCSLHPAFHELDFIVPDKFIVSVMIDILLMPMTIIIDEMSASMRIRVRNYILRYFFFNYSGAGVRKFITSAVKTMNISVTDFNTGQTDYLTPFLSNYGSQLSSDPFLFAFIEYIRGWDSLGKGAIPLSGIAHADLFINGNRVHYTPRCGVRLQNKGKDYPQLDKFVKFVNEFTSDTKFNSITRQDYSSILRTMLHTVSNNFHANLCDLMWYMDEVVRRTSLCSIMRPYDGKPFTGNYERKKLIVKPFSIYSMIRLTEAKKIDYVPLDIEVLSFGWSVHQWFEGFSSYYAIHTNWFKEYKEREAYNKENRVQFALSKMPDIGIKRYLTTESMHKANFNAMIIPPPNWPYYTRKFEEARRFISHPSLHGHLGYVTHAFQVPYSVAIEELPRFREIYDIPGLFDKNDVYKITRDKFIKLLTTKDERSRTEFNNAVKANENSGTIIRYDFPFKLEEKKIDIKGPDTSLPFDLKSPLKLFDYGKIYFQYVFYDEYFNEEAPERALLYTPKFIPPVRPLISNKGLEFVFSEFRHTYTVFRKIFIRYAEFKIIQRER